MRWLICVDGTQRAHRAAAFAANLLRPGKDEVVLLGIVTRENRETLEKSLEQICKQMGDMVLRQIVRRGSTAEAIEAETQENDYDIALYGSRGRRGITRMLFGSVAARLAHDINCSLLIVRKPPKPVRKILICTTLDNLHQAPLLMGATLAEITGAMPTILHVMSQIPLFDEANLDQLEVSADEAITQRTREGLGFLRAKRLMQSHGVKARTLIRHGLVIDEILDEVVSGDYDLVVIGAHASEQESRLQSLMVEDITNTVLLDTGCPVLIVRGAIVSENLQVDEE